ncbi:UPF0149 family protein [Pseudomonas sp. F1_0610]|uniref:UPF0149 family protein n=1 Tax=Pseudomonas sp. F1_0610 TaxID=3114284 RepID=UPI0039C4752F
MSEKTSAYQAFAALLGAQNQPLSPAELQGLLIGRCCGGANFEVADWLTDAAELFDGEIPESLHAPLAGLLQMTQAELQSSEVMALTLLLPDDDCSIAERTQAVAMWCQSFLAGFGLVAGSKKLSTEANEVLEDLVSITQIQSNAEENEDTEDDFMQVSEYLRIAPILLFNELGQHSVTTEPNTAVH